MQAVDSTPTNLRETLLAGDELRIVDRQRRQTELVFIAIEDGVLKGTLEDPEGTTVESPLGDIESIEVRKISGGRTALAGGGFVLLYTLIGVLLLRAL